LCELLEKRLKLVFHELGFCPAKVRPAALLQPNENIDCRVHPPPYLGGRVEAVVEPEEKVIICKLILGSLGTSRHELFARVRHANRAVSRAVQEVT